MILLLRRKMKKFSIGAAFLVTLLRFSPAEAHQISLTWNKVTTYINGTPIVTPPIYEIWRATNASLNDAQIIGTSLTASFKDGSVANNKTYYYFVKASVSGMKSGSSNVLKIKS